MIEIVRFNKHSSGSLYGYLDVKIPAWNSYMIIHGIPMFLKNGNMNFALPNRAYTNDNGETKYAPLIEFEDHIKSGILSKIAEAWASYEQQQSMQAAPAPQAATAFGTQPQAAPQQSVSELPF